MRIKKILVSQPKPDTEKSPYLEFAKKHNIQIEFRPFIHVEDISAKEFREQKISILDHTAVMFTSRTAIDHFFLMCEELRVAMPATMKYLCVSESPNPLRTTSKNTCSFANVKSYLPMENLMI